jgi:hypothetical protein
LIDIVIFLLTTHLPPPKGLTEPQALKTRITTDQDQKNKQLLLILILFILHVCFIRIIQRHRRIIHQRPRILVARIIDKRQTARAFFFLAFGFGRHGKPLRLVGCITFEKPYSQSFQCPTARHEKPGTRPGLLSNIQSMMAVFVFVLVVLVTTAGMPASAVVTQVVAHRTTGCAAQTGTDGGTGGAAQAVTNHRAAGSTEPPPMAASVRLCLFAPTALPAAPPTCANRGTGAAAELATDHVTEHTAQSATDGGATIAGGHRTLGDQ